MSYAPQKSLFPKVGLGALVIGLVVVGTQPSFAAPKGGLGGSGLGAGAAASGDVSTQGSLNSNAPSSADRATGLDRAQDRMSAEGAANTNALDKETGAARAQSRASEEGLGNSQAASTGDTDVASNLTSKHRKQKSE